VVSLVRPAKPAQLVGCGQCHNPLLLQWDDTAVPQIRAVPSLDRVEDMAPRGSVMEGIFSILGEVISELPVLAEVPQRVVTAVHDPISNMDDIAVIIEDDAVLSMKVLSLANSAYFATISEINDLSTACARLGMKALANIAYTVANANLYKTSDPMARDVMQQLWRHAVATAHSAEAVGRKVGLDQNTSFIGGLVHDIGKAVLLDAITTKYTGNVGRLRESQDLLVRVLDRHAPLVGLHVVQYWKLAPEFAYSTLYSMEPRQLEDERWQTLAHTISLGNIMADQCGYLIGTGEPAALDPDSFQETLGLSAADIAEIKAELDESLDAIVGVLGAM
jgi:HD-like signal output (HDOD) protein